jgi:hypothetical protein
VGERRQGHHERREHQHGTRRGCGCGPQCQRHAELEFRCWPATRELSQPNPKWLALATTEGMVAAALMLQVFRIPIALAALGLSCGFLATSSGYARDERCQCFGRRLPTSSRLQQRVRACYLVTASTLCVIGSATASQSNTAAIVGSAIGVAVIVGPWAWEWAVGAQLPERGVHV